MNTTKLVVEIRPEKKFSSVHNCDGRFYIRFLNRSAHIWFSYNYSPYSPLGRFIWIQRNNIVGLLAQLVERCKGIAAIYRRVQIPYGPEFFSGLISTTSSVAFITARVAAIFVSSTGLRKNCWRHGPCAKSICYERLTYCQDKRYGEYPISNVFIQTVISLYFSKF